MRFTIHIKSIYTLTVCRLYERFQLLMSRHISNTYLKLIVALSG